MPHVLPPLPYAEDALEPYVGAPALRLHREVHRQDVGRLNRALERTRWAERPVDETLRRLDEILDGPITAYRRTKARHHGGSHLNHSLLWESLRPPGGPPPAGALAAAVERDFGSPERLVDRMTRAALALTGSGWAWLVHDGAGLAVTVTRDNESPVSAGHAPLLALDMWEHAHLPQHGLDRRAHVGAFWHLVDWESVARRLAAAERSARAAGGNLAGMDERRPEDVPPKERPDDEPPEEEVPPAPS